jgi:hypothetical protein
MIERARLYQKCWGSTIVRVGNAVQRGHESMTTNPESIRRDPGRAKGHSESGWERPRIASPAITTATLTKTTMSVARALIWGDTPMRTLE